MTDEPRRWRDDPALGDSAFGAELRQWLRSEPAVLPLSTSTRQAVAGRIQRSLASGAGAHDLPDATQPTPASGLETAAAAAPRLVLLSAAKLAGVLALAGAALTAAWFSSARVSSNVSRAVVRDGPAGVAREARDPAGQAVPEGTPASEARAPSAGSGSRAEAHAPIPLPTTPSPGAPTPAAAAPSTARATARAAAPSATRPHDPERDRLPEEPASALALREEVRLLRGAREQLPLHPARAAELLRQYAARFPDGALKAEYAALAARVGAPGPAGESQP